MKKHPFKDAFPIFLSVFSVYNPEFFGGVF